MFTDINISINMFTYYVYRYCVLSGPCTHRRTRLRTRHVCKTSLSDEFRSQEHSDIG